MSKKPATLKEPAAFDLPAEVKDLPPELRGAKLTLKQKRKDEKRRDQMMALHGTAARLSNEEQALNQARISSPLYRSALDQLLGLVEVPTRKRGCTKPELQRRIKATAHNLADALVEEGLLDQAYGILSALDPKAPQLKEMLRVGQAIARDDDDHCKHPATDKFVKKRIYVPHLGDWVDLIACVSCPCMNATRTPPADVEVMRKARAEAPAGASDETVFTMARKLMKSDG